MKMDASGPVFIKLAQWLSSRRDLFEDDLCDAMSVLHEHVTATACATDAEVAQQVAPGLVVGEMLGAGCIARVYSGRWEGKEVAVKVRRENVTGLLELDLQLLRSLASVLMTLRPELQWMMLDKALDIFSEYMLSQTDFRTEAANLTRFKSNLRGTAGVPSVYASSESVLVMEFIEGVSLTKFLKTEADPKLRYQVWSILSDQTAKMALADNFVHADLHPGNIMVTWETRAPRRGRTEVAPRLIFIDAGMAIELPDATSEYLREAFRGAIEFNAERIGQAFVNMHRDEGLCSEAPPNLAGQLGVLGLLCTFTCKEALWSQVFSSQSEYLGARTPDYFNRLAWMLTTNEIRISPSLWSMLTSFALIEGSLHELGFKTNVMRAAMPYVVSCSPTSLFSRVAGWVRVKISETMTAATGLCY